MNGYNNAVFVPEPDWRWSFLVPPPPMPPVPPPPLPNAPLHRPPVPPYDPASFGLVWAPAYCCVLENNFLSVEVGLQSQVRRQGSSVLHKLRFLVCACLGYCSAHARHVGAKFKPRLGTTARSHQAADRNQSLGGWWRRGQGDCGAAEAAVISSTASPKPSIKVPRLGRCTPGSKNGRCLPVTSPPPAASPCRRRGPAWPPPGQFRGLALCPVFAPSQDVKLSSPAAQSKARRQGSPAGTLHSRLQYQSLPPGNFSSRQLESPRRPRGPAGPPPKYSFKGWLQKTKYSTIMKGKDLDLENQNRRTHWAFLKLKELKLQF
ncbi:uncharacterized protein LOC126068677 [Elephas maximus indicus]|uniref:uncharacterized protein LOC126068677 n=1 Tax=Elephas maximus indicus TaxID=99487 RepID=UPI00211656FC|nr:uncharacterized protein LOC126068677 [Elephas maximus indicus]